jgi:hypothetical protein
VIELGNQFLIKGAGCFWFLKSERSNRSKQAECGKLEGMRWKILKWIKLAVVIVAVLMISLGVAKFISDEGKGGVKIGGDGFGFDERVAGYEVYKELDQGCSGRDCVPVIDKPEFDSIEEANGWLKDDEVMLAYSNETEYRAYPKQIMNWHEVINDRVRLGDEEQMIVITYCPLCGSAVGFERKIVGKELSFGVSGKLKDSCLVMYDRETKSLWEQITGKAIVGEMRGEELKPVAINMLTYGEWKSQFPSGKVLSRRTGYERDYERYPYGNYEQSEEVFYPVEGGVDRTVHLKTEVYGVVVNGEAKAYTKEALERETEYDGVLGDTIGEQRVRVSFDRGEIRVENLSNKKEAVVPTRMFWFAWKAYYPQTELYQ